MNLIFLIIIISRAACLKRGRVLATTIRWTFVASAIHGVLAFFQLFGEAEGNHQLEALAFPTALIDLGLATAVVALCFGTSATLKCLFVWRRQASPSPLPQL
jgi:hypothetical protein